MPENLVQLVQSLRPHVEQLQFVSTGISPEFVQRLSPYAEVVARENFGYDFWSYKVGLDCITDIAGHDRILLINSSFITFFPDVLIACLLRPVGSPKLRGISISHQIVRHIQSYCVAFENRELIASSDFAQWWGALVPISDREQVIHQYELGMSRFFASRGWSLEAELEADRTQQFVMVARAIGNGNIQCPVNGNVVSLDLDDTPLNPTHFLWETLLERSGTMKIELVRDNPESLPLDRLRAWLQDKPQFSALIDDALA